MTVTGSAETACTTCNARIVSSVRFCPHCGSSSVRQTEQPPTETPGTEWYYESKGERIGPVSENELLRLIQADMVQRDTLVWNKNMAEWQRITGTALATRFQSPPPLGASAVTNAFAWVLAFAPIIGQFIEGFLSGLTEIEIDELWWVTLCLNIGLSYADERTLRKAGYDTKPMGAAWLIPVYLYKRSMVLKQNKAPFIMWIIGFVLVILGVL
jgi:hypothetical protein